MFQTQRCIVMIITSHNLTSFKETKTGQQVCIGSLFGTVLFTVSGSLPSFLWSSSGVISLLQYAVVPPPTHFCAFIVKYVTFLYVTDPTIQLYTYCFRQLIFKSIKKGGKECNYSVFYNYLSNYLHWCSLFCVCVDLNYCLESLAFSISCKTHLPATNSVFVPLGMLLFLFFFER